ncbi:MAG: DUF5011 domain-containing protein [Clostridiales bacterium]|nr:DUF5011 domain-containing protein [Clostridiales bacterium]
MKRRKKKRILQVSIMLLSLFALIIVAGISYLEARPMLVKALTIEAGTSSVDLNDFLLKEEKNVSFVTDMNNLDMNVPGVYEIEIQVNRRVHTSVLEIVDTIPPKADPLDVVALKDENVNALDFVENIIDNTEVNVSFINEPDTSVPGEKLVKVAIEDMGRNHIVVESTLTILDVKSVVEVEAGTVMDIKPSDFVKNADIEVRILSDISQLDISMPTVHPIEIEVDGRVLKTDIAVVDTTPPSATAVNGQAWLGEALDPSVLVQDVFDISPVEVSFAGQPDFNLLGDQEVDIIVEDIYGNKTELKTSINVREDREAPVISGVRDQTVYEGETISYKKGVSVTDNKDSDLTFQVDSTKVNLNKSGSYTVTYSAKDSSGNKAVKTATITVIPFVVSDEMLYEKVDKILDKIVDEGMTKREIAYEIYLWVKGHVAYTGSSDKSDWKKGAYLGIEKGLGDCFTYYAVSEALLTRAGIDNMRVTRVGGRTQHFWNLIDCGDGWYHFDTCPNKDKIDTFMLTDAQVEEYTKKRGNNYYNFDKSLYPRTPEN